MASTTKASCRRPRSEVRVPSCALSDPNLLGNDLRVYAVLLYLSDDAHEFNRGLDVIARWSSLSRRTANRALRRLASMGYVQIRRRQRQTSIISVRPPLEVYGDAVFDPSISVRKVARASRGRCPGKNTRR